jgi:hypothetical protein
MKARDAQEVSRIKGDPEYLRVCRSNEGDVKVGIGKSGRIIKVK